MNQFVLIGLAVIQSLLQCIQHGVRPHRTADPPAHDAPGIHVDHKGDVLPALPSRDIGAVRYPQLVGTISLELPIDPVQWTWRRFVGDCGAYDFAPACTLQPQTLHQPLDGAACHRDALAVHLMPDLVGTVNLHVGMPDLLNFWHQGVIRLGACTA